MASCPRFSKDQTAVIFWDHWMPQLTLRPEQTQRVGALRLEETQS